MFSLASFMRECSNTTSFKPVHPNGCLFVCSVQSVPPLSRVHVASFCVSAAVASVLGALWLQRMCCAFRVRRTHLVDGPYAVDISRRRLFLSLLQAVRCSRSSPLTGSAGAEAQSAAATLTLLLLQDVGNVAASCGSLRLVDVAR